MSGLRLGAPDTLNVLRQTSFPRSLRVCIKNLRGKLEPDPRRPRYLVTETGLGYRLRMDEEAPADAAG